jgi:hypothetical protein
MSNTSFAKDQQMVDSQNTQCNGSVLSFTQQATIMSSNLQDDDRELKIDNFRPMITQNPQTAKKSLSQKPLKVKKNSSKGIRGDKIDSNFTNK